MDNIGLKDTFRPGISLRRIVNEQNVQRYFPGMQRYCSNEASKKNGERLKACVVSLFLAFGKHCFKYARIVGDVLFL